ncbi:MAG TPA: hypothetical protein VF378_03295 [Geothrix sp.]
MGHRRGLAVLFSLAFPAVLAAQGGPWTEFLATWRRANQAPATLLGPKDRLTPAYPRSDEAILRLTATGDLAIQSVEGPTLVDLREARGWRDGPHWILLGRDGSIVDEGTDLPKGEYLQSRLQAMGITLTWEALEQFLRLHPDNGSALQRRLNISTSLARRRFLNLRDQGKVDTPTFSTESWLPGIQPAASREPALPDDWCREVEDTLQRLNQLPDPWRLGSSSFQFWLDLYGQTISTGVRAELARLSGSILEAWRRRPHSGRDWLQTAQEEGMGLGPFWMACERASRPSGELPELPPLTPSPGRFWPHPGFLLTLPWLRPDGSNAKEILSLLEGLPTEVDSSHLWNDTWSEWLQFRCSVSSRQVMAWANLGRWQEATLALHEIRRNSGKQWMGWAAYQSDRISKSASPTPNGKGDAPAKALPPEAFMEVLRLPAVEEPTPPPQPAPLRFLVWGQPDWLRRWETLRSTSALAPWGAGELKRESPSDADTLKLTRGGFPAAGWAVFQGAATLVARGEGAPDAALLAMQLRSVAPSHLHLLDDFIARHPEHLDARKDRLALVRARMPQPALESRLLEDAARTFHPLDFGPDAPWISDLEGWRTQALKVVPELESVQQRWPDNAGLWRAWIAWSAFLPKPPSVVTHATGLPVFGSRQSWISGLPAQVHRAVATECRNGRRFGLMVDWFEGAWPNMVSRIRSTDPPQVAEREKAIYEGYREALTALGRTADRSELDRAWASVQPKQKAEPRP